MAQNPDKQILGTAPCFFVKDIQRSVAYYRDVLGFATNRIWGEPPCFAMPQRDGFTIMLSQAEDPLIVRPNGSLDAWDAYVWVLDADALFEEFTSKGVLVGCPPQDQLYYGNREFTVKDPDGYVLAFAHDIESKKKRMQSA